MTANANETRNARLGLAASVFACMLGIALAVLASAWIHTLAISGAVYASTRGWSLRLEPLLTGLLVGLLLGGGQWLVLRQRLPESRRWVGLTTLGTAAAWVTFNWLVRPALSALALETGEIGFGLLFGGVWGGLVGGAQWLMLRRRVEAAYLWWLACAAAFPLAAAVVRPLNNMLVAGLVFAAVQGLLAGGVLGWALPFPAAPRLPAHPR